MSKVKKILTEARDMQNREIDLVEQNIGSIEECPSLCEFSSTGFALFWKKNWYF